MLFLYLFNLGSQRSPAYKSKFCEYHKQIMSMYQGDSEEMEEKNSQIVKKVDDQSKNIFPIKVMGECVTRNASFFQVYYV